MRLASIRHLVFILGTIVLLSFGGCGGSDKSCTDSCKALFACGDKLGAAPKDFLGSYYETESTCIERCNSGDCEGKQKLLNCVGDIECSSLSQAKSEITACFMSTNCAP
jgi:hypothetical protein